MDSDQYIVEPESVYTPFSDMQAKQYFGATRGYSRQMDVPDYNTDVMKVPYAQPVRTAEAKFMAGQVGMPAYLLNYQRASGVPYDASVDKSIIPGFIRGDPRDTGTPMGNSTDVSAGTREYYPRAGVIDSHSPLPGRVHAGEMGPVSQQAKTQWPWPAYEPCSQGRDQSGRIVIAIDPNMLILFIFIAIVALVYVSGMMFRKIEKIASMLMKSGASDIGDERTIIVDPTPVPMVI